MQTDNYGIVYVLRNPEFPSLVKIGKTTRDNFHARMRELNKPTQTPVPFECLYACKVALGREYELEQALHRHFAFRRNSSNREFFRMGEDEVCGLLDILCQFSDCEDVTDELLAPADGSRSKRPNIDYLALGLQVGDRLIYTEDESIVCTIAGPRKVDYEDQHSVSLFSITRPLKGAVRPAPFWKTEKGITLDKLYDEHNH